MDARAPAGGRGSGQECCRPADASAHDRRRAGYQEDSAQRWRQRRRRGVGGHEDLDALDPDPDRRWDRGAVLRNAGRLLRAVEPPDDPPPAGRLPRPEGPAGQRSAALRGRGRQAAGRPAPDEERRHDGGRQPCPADRTGRRRVAQHPEQARGGDGGPCPHRAQQLPAQLQDPPVLRPAGGEVRQDLTGRQGRRLALRPRPCRLHGTAGCPRLDGQAVAADRLALRTAQRLRGHGAGRADRRPVRLQRGDPRVVRPRCRSQPSAVPAVRRHQGGRDVGPADAPARQPAGTRPPVRRRPAAPGPAGGIAAYPDPAQRRQGFRPRHQGVVLHDAAGAAGDREGRGRRAGNGRGADHAPFPHAGTGRADRPEGGDGPAAGADGRAGAQDQLHPGPGPFAAVTASAPPDAGGAGRHGRQAAPDQQLRRQRIAPGPEDEGAEQHPRPAQRRPASRRYPVEADAHGRDGLHRLPDRKPHPGEDRQPGSEPCASASSSWRSSAPRAC